MKGCYLSLVKERGYYLVYEGIASRKQFLLQMEGDSHISSVPYGLMDVNDAVS